MCARTLLRHVAEFGRASRSFGYSISGHEGAVIQMHGETPGWRACFALLFRSAWSRAYRYWNREGSPVKLPL